MWNPKAIKVFITQPINRLKLQVWEIFFDIITLEYAIHSITDLSIKGGTLTHP
jgi:hypothetical protein